MKVAFHVGAMFCLCLTISTYTESGEPGDWYSRFRSRGSSSGCSFSANKSNKPTVAMNRYSLQHWHQAYYRPMIIISAARIIRTSVEKQNQYPPKS